MEWEPQEGFKSPIGQRNQIAGDSFGVRREQESPGGPGPRRRRAALERPQ